MTEFTLNGTPVSVGDHHEHLLTALRDELGVMSPKDGCSPSGQCGCCTVIVDGKASWRYGGAATYVDLEPGVALFNHPNDRHGTTAGDDPLIAMYVLWGGDPT